MDDGDNNDTDITNNSGISSFQVHYYLYHLLVISQFTEIGNPFPWKFNIHANNEIEIWTKSGIDRFHFRESRVL